MGLNLNIQRIVFSRLRKFDGEKERLLYDDEIKQIAGRAGRFRSKVFFFLLNCFFGFLVFWFFDFLIFDFFLILIFDCCFFFLCFLFLNVFLSFFFFSLFLFLFLSHKKNFEVSKWIRDSFRSKRFSKNKKGIESSALCDQKGWYFPLC